MTNLATSAFGSRYRNVAYWVTTALVVFELALGGVWDILRVPQVRGLIERLGYPQYFLIILGIWKLLGAVALVIPRFPRLKEWAYAGVLFDLTGAIGHGDDGCGYDRIPDRNDGHCSCVLGASSAIPPPWFRSSSPPKWARRDNFDDLKAAVLESSKEVGTERIRHLYRVVADVSPAIRTLLNASVFFGTSPSSIEKPTNWATSRLST